MNNTITVVFFDENQINNFLKTYKFSKEYVCFPLTPNAKIKLDELKINNKILSPLEYFDDTSHSKIINNVKKIEEKIQNFFNENNQISLSSKYTFQSILHLSISSSYYIRFLLEKTNNPWLIFINNEWKKVFDYNLACSYLIQNRIHEKKGVFREYRNRSYKFSIFINIINKLIIKICSKKQIIWSTGLNYGLQNLINEFSVYKKCIFFYLGPSDNLAILRSFNSLFKALNPFKKYNKIMITPSLKKKYNNNFKKELSQISFDDEFFNFIKKDIFKFVNNFIIYTEDLENNVNQLLKQTKPRLIIAHQLRMLEPAVLGFLAKKMNIEVELISHGSHTPQSNKYSLYENKFQAEGLLFSNIASKVILQSPLAEETYKYYANKNNFERYKPIMWGYKKSNIANVYNNKFDLTILYAGTLKSLGIRPWIYETSNEFFESVKILINVLKDYNNIELIIKARENDECSISNLLTLTNGYSNCFLESKGDFVDYLEKSDLLISYSSTTIEEALNYKKPVAIYGYSDRYIHIVEPKLNSKSNLKPVYNLNIKNIKKKLPMIINSLTNKKVPDNFFNNYVYNNEAKNLSNYITNNIKK